LLAPEIVAPHWLWVPEHSSTAGGEAIDLMGSLGFTLDPEQRLALEVMLAEQPGAEGRWAALEACIIAARQNLKTFCFLGVALSDLYLFGAELVTWTAHEFNTAMEAFRQVDELVQSHPFLSKRVKHISRANGDEGIELHGGARLRFKARTKSGGRGLTGDRIILDEAFALQPAHMGALFPTLSAKSIHGNPQVLYGSSAGLTNSGVLRSIRDRGRIGNDPGLAYIEWADDDTVGSCAIEECTHAYGNEGCRLDDEERWQAANPALGRRIAVDFVRKERRALPPAEFARERLGWWDAPPPSDDDLDWEVITEDAWLAGLTEASPTWMAPTRWAVDVAPNARSASIVASDGTGVEVIDHRDGTAWIVDRLYDLRTRHQTGDIVLDATGPVAMLLDDLERRGIPVQKVTLDEHQQACEQLLAAVNSSGADDDVAPLGHIGQEPLDDAARVAKRRPVRDRWLWTRTKSTGDISPLVAATLARWSARQFIVTEVIPTPGYVSLNDYLDEE
jgi:hypothetical protein